MTPSPPSSPAEQRPGTHVVPGPAGHGRIRLPRLSRRDWMTVATIAAVCICYVALLVRLLGAGADDLGLVGVLSTDEQLAGQTVRHMVDAHTLSPRGFFSYGA